MYKKKYMNYKNYTYEELNKKYLNLSEERNSLMDECAKLGLPFNEYVEKAKGLTEEILLIRREMRLKETPTMEYGKTWKGDTFTIEEFLELSKSHQLIDDNGTGYYATDNAKSNIIACPSDFEDGEYRKDFTHIIWFNK